MVRNKETKSLQLLYLVLLPHFQVCTCFTKHGYIEVYISKIITLSIFKKELKEHGYIWEIDWNHKCGCDFYHFFMTQLKISIYKYMLNYEHPIDTMWLCGSSNINVCVHHAIAIPWCCLLSSNRFYGRGHHSHFGLIHLCMDPFKWFLSCFLLSFHLEWVHMPLKTVKHQKELILVHLSLMAITRKKNVLFVLFYELSSSQKERV